MLNKSARDSSTRIQRQIYPVSRVTTWHSISANLIFLFSFPPFFFLKRSSPKSGFHHLCEALLLCLEVKWGKPCITAILGISFPFSRNSSEVCVGIPFHDRSSPFFFWLEVVGSLCSLLNGGFPSSHLPCALKHGQSQAFLDLSRSWS